MYLIIILVLTLIFIKLYNTNNEYFTMDTTNANLDYEIAKAKAKVVKLQQAKQAKVAKLQQAKVDKLQQAKVVKTNTPAKTAEQKEGQLEMSRLQKIIDDSAEVDTDVEEFNTILKQNGIKI